jgi:hypothetical protein
MKHVLSWLASVGFGVLACSGPVAAPPASSAAPPPSGTCGYAKSIADGPATPLETAIAQWLASPSGSRDDDWRASVMGACGKVEFDRHVGSLRGDAPSCALLGAMYATGDGVARDDAKAAELLRRAAFGANAFDLGGCELGAPFIQRGIESDATMCCRIARDCDEGCEKECARAITRVKDKVVSPLERACEGGHLAACMLVVEQIMYGAYWDGLGWIVEQDPALAKRKTELLCARGVGHACTQRAHYESGDALGSPSIATTAKINGLFRRACELGDGPGCAEYAKALRNGAAPQHGTTDELAAWDAACTHGMHAVCTELAEIFDEGKGVLKDPARAARYRALGTWPRD